VSLQVACNIYPPMEAIRQHQQLRKTTFGPQSLGLPTLSNYKPGPVDCTDYAFQRLISRRVVARAAGPFGLVRLLSTVPSSVRRIAPIRRDFRESTTTAVIPRRKVNTTTPVDHEESDMSYDAWRVLILSYRLFANQQQKQYFAELRFGRVNIQTRSLHAPGSR
jgi:hypothetical protein